MPPHNSPNDTGEHTPTPATRRPWRATVRTVLIAGMGLLPLLPSIASAAHIETIPLVVSILVTTAAIQRVIEIPAVRQYLRYWFRFLSPEPDIPPPHSTGVRTYQGRHRKDE